MQKTDWTTFLQKIRQTKNLNIMKNKILSIVLAFAVFACSAPDKKAELTKMIKERDALNDKIKVLEEEIAKADTTKKVAKGKRVNVTPAAFTEFAHYIEVQGKIDGDQNLAIYPEAMGVIEEIYVKPGQSVRKGQLLARLNDATLREQIKSVESNYKFANEVFEKQKNLWEQKVGSEMQYLQAKNNKESLESQLAALKRQQEMMQIKSPIDGTIEEAPIKIGQMAAPQLPVFRILSFGGLKVSANVSEGYASKIKNGDELIVYLPDLKKEIKATVNFSSKYINPVNRTFEVEGRINSNIPNLKANMIAVLKIKDYKNPNTIVLPVNLVQHDMNGSHVMIAESTKNSTIAKKVKVSVGETYNGEVEIKEGIKPGDLVITTGYLDLENGQSIVF